MRLAISLALLAFVSGCGTSEESAPASDGALRLDGPAPGPGSSAPPAVEVPASAPVVLFLGDSIGAGLHLPEHEAFPAVLARRCAAAGVPFRLVNSSESGRTTAGGATALDWALRSGPDVVVIELGGNDGLRGVALESVEENLVDLIERSEATGARVVLLGVRLPENYGDYGEAFDAIYPRLAADHDVAFVPYFMRGVGGVPELNLPDGLHPTAEGHERLAAVVEPVLRRMLDELPAR
ncbi:MAG: arylesterase [bacterium]|nr:arylesterase [bacterium]